MATVSPKIVPHLWYAKEAVEAANFYATLFPDSGADSVTDMPGDSPSGPEGSDQVVEFTLAGQSFMAINAGPLDPFNHAVSFIVNCKDQAEIDLLWDKILKHGGQAEQCGWIKDRYGLCWQIVPRDFEWMMKDKDWVRARRVVEAMLKMVKLDVAALQRAYDGV